MTALDKSDIEIIKGLRSKGWSDFNIAAKMGIDVREVSALTIELNRADAMKVK